MSTPSAKGQWVDSAEMAAACPRLANPSRRLRRLGDGWGMLRNIARVLKNAVSDQVVAMERQLIQRIVLACRDGSGRAAGLAA